MRALLRKPNRCGFFKHFGALLLMLLGGPIPDAAGEIQFDVFLGYDDRIRESHWFPVAYEILNDGPPLTALVVLGPDNASGSQERSFSVELPTGTRKRVVLPVFSSTGRYSRWETRLLDASGKVLAERAGLQPKDLAAHVPLLGGLPRSFGGLPTLPEIPNRSPESLPAVARLQSDLLPSNPIALQGLTACYLNSEKAADLKPDQVDALLAWLHAGGHLIVGIEKAADASGVPWLGAVLPIRPTGITNVTGGTALEEWLRSAAPGSSPTKIDPNAGDDDPLAPGPGRRRFRNGRNLIGPGIIPPTDSPYSRLPSHAEFSSAPISCAIGDTLGSTIVVAHHGVPLLVSVPRGRGTVTALTFSPEREPFRGWKLRAWFWAKLLGVPPGMLAEQETARWGAASVDAFLGTMLDSRQVRKLPVATLLLLLIVYLVVIGPFDQWILKRTGKQMWTWVTFPIYVVLFSGLIYFIGYRLRAGELEWNELQIVDQLPRGDDATFRGRTWASIYSPANARYRFATEQPFAAFRPEHLASMVPQTDAARLITRYPGRGFEAEAFVPVWVNQLYASDWYDTGPTLVRGLVQTNHGEIRVSITNQSSRSWGPLSVALGESLYSIGSLGPGEVLQKQLVPADARSLEELRSQVPTLVSRAQQRRQAFGNEGSGQTEKSLEAIVTASVLNQQTVVWPGAPYETFTAPADLEISPQLARGDAVLFAWAPGQGIAPPFYRFSPKRIQRDTILRVILPAAP